MHKVIWKFGLAEPGYSTMTHEIPAGAVFSHVDWQSRQPFFAQVWFVVDEKMVAAGNLERRTFQLVATGQMFEGEFLGTFVHRPTETVWHLIDVTGE